jgi:hypothetical protein
MVLIIPPNDWDEEALAITNSTNLSVLVILWICGGVGDGYDMGWAADRVGFSVVVDCGVVSSCYGVSWGTCSVNRKKGFM